MSLVIYPALENVSGKYFDGLYFDQAQLPQLIHHGPLPMDYEALKKPEGLNRQ